MGILKLKSIPKKTLNDVHVLIVDDDEFFLDAMIFELKRHGIQVIGAQNGNEAFEYIQNNSIDIVISDVRMPNGSGIELLEKVHSSAPYLPVVMLVTGFADITSEEAHDKGASALFSKPFQSSDLVEAIKKMVDNQNTEASPRPLGISVDVRFQESGLSNSGKLLTLGKSGMFLAIETPFPQIAEPVSLKVNLEDGTCLDILGTIKWVHVQSTDYFPSGCGIEFNHLTEKVRETIEKLLEENGGSGKFIPIKAS